MSARDPAARAIALLRNARGELEQAMIPPGALILISRQAAEAIIDDLRAAARAIREMSEVTWPS